MRKVLQSPSKNKMIVSKSVVSPVCIPLGQLQASVIGSKLGSKFALHSSTLTKHICFQYCKEEQLP